MNLHKTVKRDILFGTGEARQEQADSPLSEQLMRPGCALFPLPPLP